MQRFVQFVGALASPAVLIVVIWGGALACLAIGPIDYAGQPSTVVLTVVVLGVLVFLAGSYCGQFLFDRWGSGRTASSAVPTSTLARAVTITSLFGIVGIASIALDRLVLSGVNNSSYSELLRCAPSLIETVAIKRTPFLHLGYVLFSFGFAAVVLFVLKGEEIRGWPAALAQLSIVSPIGYALLYSGRMPILFVIILVVAAMLVRLSEGRTLLPKGHYLLIKTAAGLALFGIYSSAMWGSRQDFCAQMSPLIEKVRQQEMKREALRTDVPAASTEAAKPNQSNSAQHDAAIAASKEAAKAAPALPSPAAPDPNGNSAAISSGKDSKVAGPPAPKITAAELSQDVAAAKAASAPPTAAPRSIDGFLSTMRESWNVEPRGYVINAIDNGYLSARNAQISLSTYFYLTHGVRSIDTVWRARDKISTRYGLYEIGVLSPLMRILAPQSKRTATMEAELRSANIYGFFPSVWAAAFIDFGTIGAIIYILIWGMAGGWSVAGVRRSRLVTPQLLLVFVLASIMLSPTEGPLGIANSALVLISMIVVGAAIDLWPGARKPADSTKE